MQKTRQIQNDKIISGAITRCDTSKLIVFIPFSTIDINDYILYDQILNNFFLFSALYIKATSRLVE